MSTIVAGNGKRNDPGGDTPAPDSADFGASGEEWSPCKNRGWTTLAMPLYNARRGPRLRAGKAQVAQSVEQRTENPRVGGSIPPLAIKQNQRLTRDRREAR